MPKLSDKYNTFERQFLDKMYQCFSQAKKETLERMMISVRTNAKGINRRY